MSEAKKRPAPSALASQLMRMETEEVQEEAAALGVSAADRAFTGSNGLRFILLDAEFQKAEAQVEALEAERDALAREKAGINAVCKALTHELDECRDARFEEGCDECNKREEDAIERAEEAEAERDKLREALDRLLTNARHIFDKTPVRDWGETLAEADAALQSFKGEGSEAECECPFCQPDRGDPQCLTLPI